VEWFHSKTNQHQFTWKHIDCIIDRFDRIMREHEIVDENFVHIPYTHTRARAHTHISLNILCIKIVLKQRFYKKSIFGVNTITSLIGNLLQCNKLKQLHG